MTTLEPNEERKNLELAKTSLENKINYVNEKIWKIFSWSSSLLIGSIAGAVILKKVELGVFDRILLTIAVCVLTANAYGWIESTNRILKLTRDTLKSVDEQLGTYEKVEFPQGKFSVKMLIFDEIGAFIYYKYTLIILAMVSILMILLPVI